MVQIRPTGHLPDYRPVRARIARHAGPRYPYNNLGRSCHGRMFHQGRGQRQIASENGFMKCSRRWLAAGLCLSAVVLILSGRDAAGQLDPAATPAEINMLVRQLGDPTYSSREQATRRLTELGEQALPALRTATRSA